MATKTYTTKTVVHHDGEVFEQDSEIELTDKHASALLEVQAIEPAAEKEAPADKAGKKK